LVRLWDDMIKYTLSNGFPKNELKQALPNLPAYLYEIKNRYLLGFERWGFVGIGSYMFRCVETPGHSEGHICLYEPHAKILVSGDHILNDITPTVSLRSEHGNPLKEYLASLDKIEALEIDLALPGHREIFKNCL